MGASSFLSPLNKVKGLVFRQKLTIFAIDLLHEQLKTKNMYTVGYLKTLHAEDDFVDAIRELIQDFLATGTVKSFQLKDPTGKTLCEYDDGFIGK